MWQAYKILILKERDSSLQMISIIKVVIVLLALISLLWGFWAYWNFRNDFQKNREKARAFECGFDGKKSYRSSFSFRFFYILIVFLIFDIELALLLRLPLYTDPKIFLRTLIELILFILLLGLFYEWAKGALKWKL